MLLINDRSVSILVGGAHKSLHALEALIASSPPRRSCPLRVLFGAYYAHKLFYGSFEFYYG